MKVLLERLLSDSSIRRWSKRALLALFLCLTVATGGCKQGPWSLWNAYANHFIDGGRVVDFAADSHTTSEGQSYALFFALADNDRARFDNLFAWTQNNLAQGDISQRLPGWLWGHAPDGEWKLLDSNSASDSDCWIAYDLLEAGRLWNVPAYTQTGRQMLALIAAQEVADLPGFGSMLMPGPTALWQHNNRWTLNPSYLPLFLFERFAQLDPTGPWGAISMNIPRFLRQSVRHGFAMDWVDYVPGDGFYPAPPPGTQPVPPAPTPATAKSATPTQPAQAAAIPKPPLGSYDAIRVYLWAGMLDSADPARADLLSSLAGMGAYLASDDHAAPPEKVEASGLPEPADGPVGFSAAVLPYLWGNSDFAKVAARQRVRVGALLDHSSGLYGKNPVYYDQNLVLFAMGYLDGRFHFSPRGELKVEWTR